MGYWQCRLTIYRTLLRQWLTSLQQVLGGLLSLFPMAIHALFLIPVLGLGILADANAPMTEYVPALWGYLVFLFSWMWLQREAILALPYQHYLDALPISARKRQWTELGLILYAANVFLIGPLLLLGYMLVKQSDQLLLLPWQYSARQLFPLVGALMLASYYSVGAVQKIRPWLSLGLLPLLAMPWVNQLTQWQWIALLAVAIMVERQIPLPTLRLPSWPNGFWRLLIQHDISRPRSHLIRWVGLLLVTLLGSVVEQRVQPDVQVAVSWLMAFFSGCILATGLFDFLALRKDYGLYLQSLPVSIDRLNGLGVVYTCLKSLPALVLLAPFNVIHLAHILPGIGFFAAALLGILYFPRFFILFPLLLAAVLVIVI